MSSVGTSSGPSRGRVYNEVSAFSCSDDVVAFVFSYTDPETHRVRFIDGEQDELIVNIALTDFATLADLASRAADAVRVGVGRERIRRRIAADDDSRHHEGW